MIGMDTLPIDKTATCWLWTGAKTKRGYGIMFHSGTIETAHRYVYKLSGRKLSKTLQLDHLCEVIACVKPEHLEPVTRQENMRRYYSRFEGKCKQGHKMIGNNLQVYVYRGKEQKRCRQCANVYQKAQKRRMRAKL